MKYKQITVLETNEADIKMTTYIKWQDEIATLLSNQSHEMCDIYFCPISKLE